jgi:hypothetical protein
MYCYCYSCIAIAIHVVNSVLNNMRAHKNTYKRTNTEHLRTSERGFTLLFLTSFPLFSARSVSLAHSSGLRCLLSSSDTPIRTPSNEPREVCMYLCICISPCFRAGVTALRLGDRMSVCYVLTKSAFKTTLFHTYACIRMCV